MIFYLTAFGHIDGNFEPREQAYIREFINRLVAYRVRVAMKDADPAERDARTAAWTEHFQKEFRRIDAEVRSYFTESVADGEDTSEFVISRLKLHCYELFRKFNPENQTKLIRMADELASADGEVHPSEARFREELAALLATQEPERESMVDLRRPSEFILEPPATLVPRVSNYAFFGAFERNFSRDKATFDQQIRGDLALIEKTIAKWQEMRAAGDNKLGEVTNVADVPAGASFLDRFVHVLQPEPGREFELLVLGDMHGCYSCLKAALLQADFFAKVDAHHLDPEKNPAMKVIFIGDYIDRGKRSYEGILRTLMQLFLTVPDHVYILRGNHEYYLELNGRIFGGVKPAEAIQGLTGIAGDEVFAAYKRLFDAMPNFLLFDRTMFVHAGIPRDETLRDKWKNLASLNEWDVRFQMMWSDPSDAEFIPPDLQKSNSRFPFGRHQFRDFMARTGCAALIRGHERIPEGLRVVYDDRQARLITLFSAGGSRNEDLPAESNYREVTPMALLLRHRDGITRATPFAIDYERYNSPESNGFLAPE